MRRLGLLGGVSWESTALYFRLANELGGTGWLARTPPSVCRSNTLHKVADTAEAAVTIPLLHIGDATAQAVRSAGRRRIGLPGTAYTMEQDSYRSRLEGARVVWRRGTDAHWGSAYNCPGPARVSTDRPG